MLYKRDAAISLSGNFRDRVNKWKIFVKEAFRVHVILIEFSFKPTWGDISQLYSAKANGS